MDEIVLRAMMKWPAVPAVYGWLALDRRGNWLIKGPGGGFERIANAAVSEFIGRNYARDEAGRYYFQNGPQRVFVNLEYTPWVYRLDAAAAALQAHTGAPAALIRSGYADDAGALLLDTDVGPGVVLDRDLPALLELMRGADGRPADAVAEAMMQRDEVDCRLLGHAFRVSPIASGEVAARLGFVARPVPAPGKAEC